MKHLGFIVSDMSIFQLLLSGYKAVIVMLLFEDTNKVCFIVTRNCPNLFIVVLSSPPSTWPVIETKWLKSLTYQKSLLLKRILLPRIFFFVSVYRLEFVKIVHDIYVYTPIGTEFTFLKMKIQLIFCKEIFIACSKNHANRSVNEN